ncbi:dithiobiotin synthetase [Hyphomicrobium denitrificans 1NES1]|uniref:ATP-dependent dethiobiotin synthetase BioD n=1 Tax=Hyphomicrobium denitrificans 1NES1 TaxID=670307 RepID=N0BGG6_9HYPH|nr:dethiobiotin synthase [Hyphomicrobium denitrificans]AGK59501.1 dithiobiotin synthetase [Hyphomicrobium denitrificans 1NES1]
MSTRIVVAGTDTDIGKTVFSAGLTQALDGYYWKPVQAGLAGETDSEIVSRLSCFPASRILTEAYRLNTPASPHFAAERDGVEIDPERLRPQDHPTPLVIELAGGLDVPLTRRLLQIDLVADWKLPVILCSSTRLGTINHSLLSIEALKRRAIPILGIAFIGEESADSERTISSFGRVRRLGRLPRIPELTSSTLRQAFAANFSIPDLLAVGASDP